jgi:hypothetical protein
MIPQVSAFSRNIKEYKFQAPVNEKGQEIKGEGFGGGSELDKIRQISSDGGVTSFATDKLKASKQQGLQLNVSNMHEGHYAATTPRTGVVIEEKFLQTIRSWQQQGSRDSEGQKAARTKAYMERKLIEMHASKPIHYFVVEESKMAPPPMFQKQEFKQQQQSNVAWVPNADVNMQFPATAPLQDSKMESKEGQPSPTQEGQQPGQQMYYTPAMPMDKPPEYSAATSMAVNPNLAMNSPGQPMTPNQ